MEKDGGGGGGNVDGALALADADWAQLCKLFNFTIQEDPKQFLNNHERGSAIATSGSLFNGGTLCAVPPCAVPPCVFLFSDSVLSPSPPPSWDPFAPPTHRAFHSLRSARPLRFSLN